VALVNRGSTFTCHLSIVRIAMPTIRTDESVRTRSFLVQEVTDDFCRNAVSSRRCFFITVQHCCIRRRGYVPSTCTIARIIGRSVCVVQTDIYRVFAERRIRLTSLPLACAAEMPPSSAEKMESCVAVDTLRVINTY
jgi:hypothetical protein